MSSSTQHLGVAVGGMKYTTKWEPVTLGFPSDWDGTVLAGVRATFLKASGFEHAGFPTQTADM